ncbi:bifunctional 3-phosphoshikimate 1-carboxyvinyltransferase/cytidylate kinase [Gallionella capsiferriformans]|uniref:Multifunctional fusion protein n=1 Tax=Gallionella capsiferriformans (strain ES-2) TaxID=395494 RepID=D9SF76_GALCS|nr:bifunctional 3-phosphoshikimate 1-carboxyvinyltransferase/cytidylate kinase [Gallionella capsiferriformans]ADL55173.1 3-phosphoshikimate 1-carboxyvinyltransferase [Gallionella capsiferriformans ES-2]
MNPSEFINLPPLLSARGSVRLPGSKSISNRVLLLAALSGGTTIVRDLLRSDDTDRMLEGLQTLGVTVESLGNNAYKVTGCGGDFPVKNAELFLGNAGTAFRPLTAALALSGGSYTLSGVARMHERPIGDLVDALRGLGADIAYLANDGFPPLQIKPATLSGAASVSVRGDVSSQFLTALLMALPLLGRTVTVEVIGELISKPYIEITLAMMARFGIVVLRDGWKSFTVAAGSRYVAPGEIYVEGDASSASYFLAAGAIGGGPVRVEGVGRGSIQGDVRFAGELAKMGAQIEMGDNWIEARAPVNGKLQAIDLDCNHIPDAAMTLAVAALFANGTTTLRNIASWRVKETDRIHAMATELRKVGALVEEGADYIRITGLSSEELGVSENRSAASILNPQSSILNPAAGIDTYDDHRMAMCFSLAAFGNAIRINDPRCVAKTFPDYFTEFAKVTQSVPVIAIDGPSASGKGTVAQRVANELGFHYLDSGALYRLLATAAMRDGVALDDEVALAGLASRMDIVFKGEQIWLDGAPVGDELRGEACAAGASKVAALHQVRAALLAKQRDFRKAPGLVTDGRDMGSVVFPDATLKIFLTASAQIRAERRYKQLKEKGMDAKIADLLQDIRARDERDTQRSAAPLQQYPDASLLDTTTLDVDQAVKFVLNGYQCKAP